MSNLSDSKIINKLSDEIAKIARSSFGEKTQLLNQSPKRINRRYSFMFRYQIQKENGDTLFLLVKIPHHPWMSTVEEAVTSEQLREYVLFEYRVMQSAAQVISNSGEAQLTAIHLLACLVELNAIVSEEIQLSMLKDYLVKPLIILGINSAWSEFARALNLAGKWLRVFHGNFSIGSQVELKNLEIYTRFQQALSFLENKNIKYIPLLREKIVRLYNSIANKKIKLSSTHDDYHLGNIFVTSQGQVGALDLNWKENHAIYDDLSKLLIDPATRKMQVIFQGLTFRPSLRHRFETEILNGYFENSPVPVSILWLYCALATLEKWGMNEEMLESRKSLIFFLVRPIILQGIRLYFSRLINEYLEKAAFNA